MLTFALQFVFTVTAGSFAPLSAFFGGFVSQEIIKCLTNKFIPVKQIYYTDCVEVLPTIPKDQEQLTQYIQTVGEQITQADNTRGQMNVQILGQDLTEKLE